MNEMLKLRKISRVVHSSYKLNLDVAIINQVSFAGKSLRYYTPKIWTLLSFHKTSSEAFINVIKNWNVVSCSCKVCQYYH